MNNKREAMSHLSAILPDAALMRHLDGVFLDSWMTWVIGGKDG
jgi:hypothetical protein